MADLDSDASSTTSDAMLIVRPASSGKPNRLRYERCYSRRLLLQLSKSDKIRPPAGLKPLSEWYGEYELPSLHPVNSSSTAGAVNGRFAARDGQAGGSRRERERDRGAAAPANTHERYTNERETHARPAAGASATGQMGDFKLAGQRPFTLPKDGDSGDALSAGSRRRQNLRDTDLRERGIDGKERDWPATGPNADRRRQLGGEFIKKDGRAAEEGGWRSSRETMQLGRERPQRGDRFDRVDRPSYNDRDARGPPGSGSDRRRQPAWMEEEEASNSPRHSSSNAFQRRGQNGYQANDAAPAWMADEPASGNGRPDNTLEALESKSSAGQSTSEATHVDSIQAFKAQMKEMERRQKAQEQRELRREMGLPEMAEEEHSKKSGEKDESSQKTHTTSQQGQTVPPKSVFADFLMPSSSSKEKESIKAVEEKPRSSRFARMFAAEAAAASQSSSDKATAGPNATPSPSHVPSNASNIPQSSSSNNLLAALLPGASHSPAPQAARSGTSPMPPPATQNDNQSMARLMEMLHMSSAPPSAHSPVANSGGNPPGILSLFSEGATNGQSRTSSSSQSARQQPRSKGQSHIEGPANNKPSRNDMYSPELQNGQHNTSQQMHSHHQGQPTLQQQSTQPMRDVISSPQNMPQSRLANRSSGYGLDSAADGPTPSQTARHQEHIHAPIPPPQRSINLLELLGGQGTPPPGPAPPHLQNMLPSQHQQQQPQHMRGQPVQSPPPHGHFPPPGGPDQQHAQMAAFLQAQAGHAGRPLPPPGVPGSANNMQFGRPPGQGGFMPPQGPYSPQQGPFPPSQQQQFPGHMRSPSGHMNVAPLLQEQQQRLQHNPQQQQQTYNPMRGDGPANQPLPPPQAFAQQNALAQLLAQGGHPGQQYGGMRSAANGPQGYQPHQQLPPPPMHMHQNPSPLHMHQSPPPAQQNQIDLMALLTGGGHGSGFAGR